MKYRHIEILLNETKLTPEQLGQRFGMSGRTLRRWAEHSQGEKIPEMYDKAIRETVYEFMAEGLLTTESEVVKYILSQKSDNIFHAAMKDLGFADDFIKNADQSPDTVIQGIAQIGASEKKQESVNRSHEKISSFQKLSGEWKFRIQTLVEAISSKEIGRLDKFAAYGALFYLISPFDLIPDHIPVFGLLDDYVVIGIVAAFYLKKFPQLFKKSS